MTFGRDVKRGLQPLCGGGRVDWRRGREAVGHGADLEMLLVRLSLVIGRSTTGEIGFF